MSTVRWGTVSLASLDPAHDEMKAWAFQICLSRNGKPGDPTADCLQARRELSAGKRKTDAPRR